jgi:hypothetical protein
MKKNAQNIIVYAVSYTAAVAIMIFVITVNAVLWSYGRFSFLLSRSARSQSSTKSQQ